MRHFLILILFAFGLMACHRPTTNNNRDDIEKIPFDTSSPTAKNPSFSDDTFDLKILDQLKDSGQLVNRIKEGMWNEYSIDSSLFGQTTEVVIGDQTLNYTNGITLEKFTGLYRKGKREGKWSLFRSSSKKLPLEWDKDEVTEYSNGLKNGTQIRYRGLEMDTFMVTHFVNDVENGTGKIYNVNYPYNLKEVYMAKNGIQLLLKEFYDNGKPHYLFNDTTLNGMQLKYIQSYDEEGYLSQTGFFVNDSIQQGNWIEYYKTGKIKSFASYHNGLLEGTYKYFHDNGQLWTEQTYVHGKTMEIISNLDRNGNPMDKGTLKNGNGTILLYDENGKQTSIRTYKNGDLLNERTFN